MGRVAAAAVAASLAVATGFALDAVEARSDEGIAVAVHHAYGTRRSFVIEGRVAERSGGSESRPDDTWIVNLWRSLRSLRVEEEKGIPLLLTFGGHSWLLRTDDEGYFAMRGGTPPRVAPGWQPVRISVANTRFHVDSSVLVVPDGEVQGVISDVDDTVVVSEVGDRTRLLAHTLLENPLQRQAVPGIAGRYREIAARNALPEAAPVIYLTASPRQLIPAIGEFLEHNGFPRGPIVAKKVSAGVGGDPLLDQARFKMARIEAILEDLPDVRFVLSGDDGERDPEIFDIVRERHPGRIGEILIRNLGP